MPEMPTPERLQIALAKVTRDFMGKIRSVIGISLGTVEGQPAIIVRATNATPPDNFPGALQLKLANGATYDLRISWRYAANPSDKQMWKGDSPVISRPWSLSSRGQGPGNAPAFDSMRNIPEQNIPDEMQLYLPMRKPGFVNPNFWGQPFFESGTVCLPNYETMYVAFRYKVPATRMVIVTGISYEFTNSIGLFEQFEVMLYSNSDQLCRYYDLKASNAVNPAEQFAFAGHYRPLPFYGRFDHDAMIVGQIIVRGLYPFSYTPQDFLGGCVSLYLSGFSSSLMDERDGGARPTDMGEFNDIALGW